MTVDPTTQPAQPVDKPPPAVGPKVRRIRWEPRPAPKPKKAKRPVGRPRNPHLESRFQPAPEQKQLVTLLAGYGIPADRICRVIRNPHTRRPIAASTLQRVFAHELDVGAAEMDATVCAMLSTKIRQGNIVAIIWYMKNRMGWREVFENRSTGALDVSIEIKPEELAKQLEQRGLPPCVFGVDRPFDLEPRRIEGDDDADAGSFDQLPVPDVSAETDDDRREQRAARMLRHIGHYGSN